MMNLKVGDIVYNCVKREDVGKYFQDEDVTVLKEMVPETSFKIGTVDFIDLDGAVLVKEEDRYYYPQERLRLATNEERERYIEQECLTQILNYTGIKMKDFPLEVAKDIVMYEDIIFKRKTPDTVEQLSKYLRKKWNDLSHGVQLALFEELFVRFRQVSLERGNRYWMSPGRYGAIALKGLKSEDEKLRNLAEKLILENPIKNSELYREMEIPSVTKFIRVGESARQVEEKLKGEYKIPLKYAINIFDTCGYVTEEYASSLTLYDFLNKGMHNDNINFEIYKKLKITQEGLDCLIENNYIKPYDKRAIIENLNLDIEDLKTLLCCPSRCFVVNVSEYFYKYDWKDIIENKMIFRKELNNSYSISYRVGMGNYVSPEYIYKNLAPDLVELTAPKKKSNSLLKEMVAYLDTLDDTDKPCVDEHIDMPF